MLFLGRAGPPHSSDYNCGAPLPSWARSLTSKQLHSSANIDNAHHCPRLCSTQVDRLDTAAAGIPHSSGFGDIRVLKSRACCAGVSRAARMAQPPSSITIPQIQKGVQRGVQVGPRWSNTAPRPLQARTYRPGVRTASHMAESPAKITAIQSDEVVPSRPDSTLYDSTIQPSGQPITTHQLATEIKGLYAGLVMVEAKCINVDAALASGTTREIGPDQWQAMIALQRTLLYEHHDFLMATQHPSATPALRALASKYAMPARMWRHGIHSFLEALRTRRPESQEHMLAFIYLAYQMMALLYETVPAFTDTWIECLGDLARYRMAIETDRKQHSIWGGVGRWYNSAHDRQPDIGRLCHHLGILDRPSLAEVLLYTKALANVGLVLNAKDSLATLCRPLVPESDITSSKPSSLPILNSGLREAGIVNLHRILHEGTHGTHHYQTSTCRCGVDLVALNIAALLDSGSWTLCPSTQVSGELGQSHRETKRITSIDRPTTSTGVSLVTLPNESEPNRIPEQSSSSDTTSPHWTSASTLRFWLQIGVTLLTSAHTILSMTWGSSQLSDGQRSSRTATTPKRLRAILSLVPLVLYSHLASSLPTVLARDLQPNSTALDPDRSLPASPWHFQLLVQSALQSAWDLFVLVLLLVTAVYGAFRILRAALQPTDSLEQNVFLIALGLVTTTILSVQQQIYNDLDPAKLLTIFSAIWFCIEYFVTAYRMIRPSRRKRFLISTTLGTLITTAILAPWIVSRMMAANSAPSGSTESFGTQTAKLARDISPLVAFSWTCVLFELWKPEPRAPILPFSNSDRLPEELQDRDESGAS